MILQPLLADEIAFKPNDKSIILADEVFNKLSKEHYIQEIEGDFNYNYIDYLINELDDDKRYFTKLEVNYFLNTSKSFSSSEHAFDLESAYKIINLYFNRLIELSEFQLELIQKNDFDFNGSDTLDIYSEDNEWKPSKISLKNLWKQITKNDILTSKLADGSDAEAIENIKKRYANRIRRINQRKNQDIFSIAMNSLTSQFDPHSTYFSPRSAEDFELNMSLKLEGIGALLTTEDDYAKIVSLVPGGPAEKSGQIDPEDKITRIKQEDSDEFEDVIGWRVDEVVDLIRGKSGTSLDIEFIPFDSEDNSNRKIVNLIREEIKLEDRAAKSRVHSLRVIDEEYKIGIIDLPTFYIDFNAYKNRDPNYKSSSNDVKNILKEFNNSGVDGVIIDLRGNSGGALIEANKLTGLFVSSGATVQVKENSGRIGSWGDYYARQEWKKPILVLVDRYSASASEIFAGAIQDYKRGLVVGHRTFGKGTVQAIESLTSGQIKITESKFYRVTGESTQNRGVIPDIQLPSSWDIESTGESSLHLSLPWDTIPAVRYRAFKIDSDIVDAVKKSHLNRLDESPNLEYIQNLRTRYDLAKNKKELSLNINNRKLEKEERKDWILSNENNRRENLGLEVFADYSSMEEFDKQKKEEDVDIDLENDYLLEEATNIIADYIYLNQNLIISKLN
ncbi:MAG: peptidase [SAR86 cluster bacterium]|uniref:Peptidase n=1 Tax=SAR86 cluster bacterium TaxID=2030880 RepID=A0A520M489_9GAMM|nr:MAG: peptidase [SAR86 cluster bacterium]